LRLSNFQSFGATPTTIDLADLTYVLGPNGSGKTAVLEALSRLFSPLEAQRKIRVQDFHMSVDQPDDTPVGQSLAEQPAAPTLCRHRVSGGWRRLQKRQSPHLNLASDANGLFASTTNMISQCSSSPPLLVTSIGYCATAAAARHLLPQLVQVTAVVVLAVHRERIINAPLEWR
jgi:energy-coupling factor transporter ATP-binding protein EcfA2